MAAVCDACRGTGKHRSWRLAVAAALAYVVACGASVVAPDIQTVKPGVALIVGILRIAGLLAGVAALWASWCFVAGRCRACHGRGIKQPSNPEEPFLWREDRASLQPGTCRHCRYDLTGAVSDVCPECGTAVLAEGSAGHSNDAS